jgi:hypothetical protein
MGGKILGCIARLLPVAMLTATPALAQENDIYLTLTGIPSATVAPGGLVFVSGAWTSDRVNGAGGGGLFDRTDGSLSFGAGVGSAETGIGLQLTANIASLSDDFGDSGYFSIKASRRLSAEGQLPVYVALAAERLGNWGDAEGNEETLDLIVTAFPTVDLGNGPRPLMLTLGAGTHARDFNTESGVYFGVGMGLTEHFAISAAWNGDDVTLGSGFRFDALPGMHFSASIDDAFDQNDSRRVSLQATWTTDKLFGGTF